MKITVRGAALACGALLFTAAATAQPAPQASAKPAADQPPQNNQARRRAGFAPRPKPADQPAITATLGLHASGQFTGVIDPASNQLCYLLNDPAVRAPTAVHISQGTPAKPGAPVLTLQTPTDGSSGACQAIPATLAQALASNPHGYYVDVDSAAFPRGAQRAELTSARQMSG